MLSTANQTDGAFLFDLRRLEIPAADFAGMLAAYERKGWTVTERAEGWVRVQRTDGDTVHERRLVIA
jgi:hypothetical protein